MLLSKFNPTENEIFNPKTGLKGLDDIIEEFMEGRSTLSASDWNPKLSTSESKNSYHIDVDLPGVSKEDISVNVKNGYMTISGERTISTEKNENRVLKRETSYGRFYRNFLLPDNCDLDNIRADSVNGVLEIIIPKLEFPDSETRNIKID